MSDQLKQLMKGHEEKYPQKLAEQFPRIVKDIVMLWHNPDAMEMYFQKLLVTDRPHRQGFPPEVAKELFTLTNIYAQIHHR